MSWADAPGARVLVGPRAMLAVSAARIIETNRIGAIPDGAELTAKVRSLAKPVPIMLEGPLGDGADDDPFRHARMASPRSGRRDLCRRSRHRRRLDRETFAA
jgi:tRNA-specific 2-thiouridylase